MKNALIIEDQVLFSDLLLRTLKQEIQFEEIEVCRDGKTGLERALAMKPDLVLVDLYLPSLSGMEVLRHLRATQPSIHVIMMTAFETPELINEFRSAGAEGYIAKQAPLDHLLSVIRQVVKPILAPDAAAAPAPVGNLHRPPALLLTGREMELLRLVAEGNSTKEIATKMGISFKTAQTHRANLMRKLDIHEVATLTRYAIRHGLVRADYEGEPAVSSRS
ncbi:two component transcriptional regulator, LuxR family [Verrucomicrobium sp. GAS474]|uniref:response regulator n=1 Tax=Verrucomicrobium sp. GAS474 TaxID=1882831 RepID=UPI00087CCDCA|nr:response regulator transcription factor [Verrucomicrobium sp. GAS474]SDT97999.1 two component transcriptional regulator, LuxR family [Verrucomicrobium sp. GAS474]